MIVLNGTLCSNNFRRVGLIQALVNLATQILCLTILLKIVIEAAPQKLGYYFHGHRINSSEEISVTHILIDVMFFIAIDIIAYLWLLFGLIKKKQSILTGWLLFSIMELIIVQVSLWYFAFYLTITSHSEVSVLVLIIPMLITLYLTYNVCVVYTIRHNLVQETNDFCSATLLINPSAVSYPGYRIPHAPYLPNNHQTSSSCDLQMVTSSQDSTFPITEQPPPYKAFDT